MNKKIASEIAIGIILIIAIVIGGIFWLQNKKQAPAQQPVATQPAPVEQTKNENVANKSDVANNTNVVATPIIMQDNKVSWYGEAKPIATPKLFKGNSDLSIKAWEVGAMKDSKNKVIFVAIDPDDPSGIGGYFFIDFVYDNGNYELDPYSRYSSQDFLTGFLSEKINDKIVSVHDYGSYDYDRINSLEYPGFLYFNNMTFQSEGNKIFSSLEDPFFHPEKFDTYKKIYTDKIYGDVFQNTEDGGIYLKSPIGIAKVYSLKMDFFDGNTPQINWDNGVKNQDPFTYKGVGGCGSGSYADDVSSQVSLDELAPAGKINTGEIVYEYKDKNAEYLKKWYQENIDFFKNAGDIDGSKFNKNTSYDSFVSNHLVFFWKDSLGRLIRFVNTDYVFGYGCGKPVIYLYPEQTENISVKVTPTAGMTASDPIYKNGWNVIADSQSNILNLADNKTYPYLFWEGRGDSVYNIPQKGFVVAKENLNSFIDNKLAQEGLVQKEINDFKEFWIPKMLGENKPYYFVTFVDRATIDKLAPLDINPKPDTTIRVLMDYKGLDNPIDVQGFDIKTPERTGFTAVEWGGVLK